LGKKPQDLRLGIWHGSAIGCSQEVLFLWWSYGAFLRVLLANFITSDNFSLLRSGV